MIDNWDYIIVTHARNGVHACNASDTIPNHFKVSEYDYNWLDKTPQIGFYTDRDIWFQGNGYSQSVDTIKALRYQYELSTT